MDPTPREGRILRALRRLKERQSSAALIDILVLAKEADLSGEVVASDLRLLDQAGLVDWDFFHADPWWNPSMGSITAEGDSWAYWSTWSGRARRWLPRFVASLPGAVPGAALGGAVLWVINPVLEAVLAGLA